MFWLYAIWKADLFIFIFSLYFFSRSLSLSLFLQVYFSPVFSSCSNLVFVYLFKGRFQKTSVSQFTERFNFLRVLHLPWYFCERSCSPQPSIQPSPLRSLHYSTLLLTNQRLLLLNHNSLIYSACLWTLSATCSALFFFFTEEFWDFLNWSIFRSLKRFPAQIDFHFLA